MNAYRWRLRHAALRPVHHRQLGQRQKIFDLREDWWAVEAGLIEMPDVKRIVMVNLGGQIGQNMDTVAQRIVNNEMDSALDMRSDLIKNILAQNPKITTHTGNKPPYGYLDWWPNSLWVNTQLEPYNDANVRRAISRCDQPRHHRRDRLRRRTDRQRSIPSRSTRACRLSSTPPQ